MTRRLAFGAAMLVSLAGMPAQAQVLYDAFSGPHIDPTKWIATRLCVNNAYDCPREIRLGHLRLAARGYGGTSASGVTFAESPLLFKNPEAVGTIQFRFIVTSFSGQACSESHGNDEAAHPQLLAHGAFFSDGGVDVIAYLMVERRTDDPDLPRNMLRVGAFMSKGNTFFNNVDLGTVRVGEPAVATLKWEPTSDRFVVRLVKFGPPLVTEQTMEYIESDSTPAAIPFRSLRVGTFAPNCSGEQSFAAMDASIDYVRVATP
jgi:hypothetical protein